VLREGVTAQEIAKLIEQDEDISSLILAAGLGNEGPGPLVSSLAAKGGLGLPIPVTIVPGDLDDSEIDALAGSGAVAVRLGPTVLRTSTAAAVALGALGVLTARWSID
jgi:hypothetical protein